MGAYITPSEQMANWYKPCKSVDFDANFEPTEADHSGAFLYTIK